MIQLVRPIETPWAYTRAAWIARSAFLSGALGDQLNALERRRQLQRQYQAFRTAPAGYLARPPYPYRPRPPS